MNKLEETAALLNDWLESTQKEMSLTEVQLIWLLSEMALRRYNQYLASGATACIKEEVPVCLS